VVALLGVVQFFLPKDILTHVGYSLDRGVRPSFFIDEKANLPRIMSTLREPNALGAYLILPFAAITLFLMRLRDNRRLMLVGAWLLHGLAILLTFSRSAWLGAALAVALVVWWQYSAQFVRFIKRYWWVVAATVLLLALVGFVVRNDQSVKSYITHSTPGGSAQNPHSNGYHWLFVRQGIDGIVAQPGGHGPGTAGIVSIQNPNGSFLTENYYVQIAYEVGVPGLAVLIAISVVVYLRIYRRHDYVPAVLLSSFWAYVLTNMLLHTWSNEAVAAQWWLLAGLAIVGMTKKRPQV
jgi:O-antigen ligase